MGVLWILIVMCTRFCLCVDVCYMLYLCAMTRMVAVININYIVMININCLLNYICSLLTPSVRVSEAPLRTIPMIVIVDIKAITRGEGVAQMNYFDILLLLSLRSDDNERGAQ